MSRAGEASGTGASRTSTEPSGSTRATLACSPRRRNPMSAFVVSPKRCESWIKFSISHRTTWIPSRKRRLSRRLRAICRVLLRSLLHFSRTPTTTLALETQVYQAILERRAAPIIPRLKEILAKPDPALGYTNGELRFWLGWAQEVAGDHAAAQESWRQARSVLESSLKEQPENYSLIGDL